MSSGKRSENFFVVHRFTIAAFVAILVSVLFYLWNPFKEAPLKTEYHSGRDAFTVVPGQLLEPPREINNASSSPKATPQSAAIEAQLKEADKLSAGREERAQRIEELNQLIAKTDSVHGFDRSAEVVPSDQTREVYSDLAQLKERTARIEKRLDQ